MRMYFLVMYNLSPIQKGIQAGHAALEYADKYSGRYDYIDFFHNHKTFILLDGGASGDMGDHMVNLKRLGIDYAAFVEPDLNNSISAIAFLLPEKIYGKEGRDNTEAGQWLAQFSLAR